MSGSNGKNRNFLGQPCVEKLKVVGGLSPSAYASVEETDPVWAWL